MATSADYSLSGADFSPHQRERVGSLTLSLNGGIGGGGGGGGQQSPGTENGDGPANGMTTAGPAVGSPTGTAAAAVRASSSSADMPHQVQEVLQSEIGVSTLLNRLKQSIATAKEFALFLKKRAQLEDDHSAGLRKLAKMTQETMARPEHVGGTFGQAYHDMMEIHVRMADNGYQFSMSLHQMHEDLLELAAVAEKNRKGWKQNGLAAEQRVADLEAAMRKSKNKYDSLADEYDRVRTGDSSGRRAGFGFKGPRSATQHEENLLHKVQAADQDYQSRVQTLQTERGELIRTTRPEAVKALQELIRECDGGMALQVQKYASFSEKLLLSNGLSISPMKTPLKPDARSLREVVTAIDNEKDLNSYLTSHYTKVPPRTGEPKYERNPILSAAQSQFTPSAPPAGQTSQTQQPAYNQGQPAAQPAGQPQVQPQQQSSMGSRTATMTGGYPDSLQSPQGPPQITTTFSSGPAPGSLMSPAQARPPSNQHERSYSHSSVYSQSNAPPQQQYPVRNSAQASIPSSRFNNNSSQGPPQLGALSFQSQPLLQQQQQQQQIVQSPQSSTQSPMTQYPSANRPGSSGAPVGGMGVGGGAPPRAPQPAPQMAPARPVFGVSLSRLYERDGLAVPMVVYQCIQAVDLFGLGVEGIYRLSGSLPHVNKLKGMFDTDSSSPNLDFRNPENFFHDVNSVAGLLKQFFRDLPDPLLTREHYTGFIDAAKHDDETLRRDSLHAIINSLPDPNYATLRALTLHLYRVMENAPANRMTSQNLAIVFGPTLMGTGASSNIADASWQVRVVDTILQNTYQIFDDD